MDDLKNAVKSAYTFLIENPKDNTTLDNLNFYMTQKNYDAKTMLIDSYQPAYEVFLILIFYKVSKYITIIRWIFIRGQKISLKNIYLNI